MVKALGFALSLLFVIVLDQLTKFVLLTHVEYGESIVIVRDYFSLTYVRNTGAAFGFLASAHPTFRVPFFIIVPIVAMVVLGFLYRELPAKAKWRAIALGLVSGGALGNLMDRVRLGFVVDFLDFHYLNDYSFPAFNVADLCICIGVTILVISTMLVRKEPNPQHVSNPAQS